MKVKSWSGVRESNSRLLHGKEVYYHYTNPAFGYFTFLFLIFQFLCIPRESNPEPYP